MLWPFQGKHRVDSSLSEAVSTSPDAGSLLHVFGRYIMQHAKILKNLENVQQLAAEHCSLNKSNLNFSSVSLLKTILSFLIRLQATA